VAVGWDGVEASPYALAIAQPHSAWLTFEGACAIAGDPNMGTMVLSHIANGGPRARGELLYAGSSRGAVFTVVLPPLHTDRVSRGHLLSRLWSVTAALCFRCKEVNLGILPGD